MDNNQFYERFLKLKQTFNYEKSSAKERLKTADFYLDSATSDCPTAVRSEGSRECVVPRDKVDLVIDMCHRGLANNPHVAHCSRDLTLRLVRTFFYWEGQTADVDRRLQQCETCKRSSRAAQDKEPHAPCKGTRGMNESRTCPLRLKLLHKPALFGDELADCLRDTELARSGFHYDKALKFINKIRVRVERLKHFQVHIPPEQVEKELEEYVSYFKGLTINVAALRSDRSLLYGECGVVSKCQDRYQQLLQTLRTAPVEMKPPRETNHQIPNKGPVENKAKTPHKARDPKKFKKYLMDAAVDHGAGGAMFGRLLMAITAWCRATDHTMCSTTPADIEMRLERQQALTVHECWTGYSYALPLLNLYLNQLRTQIDTRTFNTSFFSRVNMERFKQSSFEEYLLYLLREPLKLPTGETIICAIKDYLLEWLSAPSCRAQLKNGLEAFSGFNIIEYYTLIHEAKLDLLIEQELKLYQSDTH